MFTLEIAIKINEIPQDKKEQLFAQHSTWLQNHYESGKFLLMGPYTTKEMTGLIIGEDRSNLEEIIKEDAFYPNFADYTINEFKVNKINPSIIDVK